MIAKDNLTEVSEGRKIVLLGLASLFFFTMVPYEDFFERIFHNIVLLTDYLKVIVTTGAVPPTNSIFPK